MYKIVREEKSILNKYVTLLETNFYDVKSHLIIYQSFKVTCK